MREILFRGKCLDTDEWLISSDIKQDKISALYDHKSRIWRGIENSTIGQFTGLYDKNGTKIFEGDIVQEVYFYKDRHGEEHENLGYKGVVEYSTEDVASCGCCYPQFEGAGFKAEDIKLTSCKIIGNIHDNPDILKKGQENEQL